MIISGSAAELLKSALFISSLLFLVNQLARSELVSQLGDILVSISLQLTFDDPYEVSIGYVPDRLLVKFTLEI